MRIEDLSKLLPAWHLKASCRDMDPALFFHDRGQMSAKAREACESCPVSRRCLEWALENNESRGVWGGTSERERRRIRRERAA